MRLLRNIDATYLSDRCCLWLKDGNAGFEKTYPDDATAVSVGIRAGDSNQDAQIDVIVGQGDSVTPTSAPIKILTHQNFRWRPPNWRMSQLRTLPSKTSTATGTWTSLSAMLTGCPIEDCSTQKSTQQNNRLSGTAVNAQKPSD